MSFNMRDYVSDDHIESIWEIAKGQSAIIQALSIENSKLENQLQQKENIIKEVREYIIKQVHRNQQFYEMDIDNILEILDKKEVN